MTPELTGLGVFHFYVKPVRPKANFTCTHDIPVINRPAFSRCDYLDLTNLGGFHALPLNIRILSNTFEHFQRCLGCLISRGLAVGH